jgi:hypothetical protein
VHLIWFTIGVFVTTATATATAFATVRIPNSKQINKDSSKQNNHGRH